MFENIIFDIVIKSYIPNITVDVLEELVDKPPLSYDDIIKYCEKLLGIHIEEINNLIQNRYKRCPNIGDIYKYSFHCRDIVEDLIRNGIINRKSIRKFDIYKREEYLEAIRRIKNRLRNKIIVYEGVLSFIIGFNIQSIYYFIKEGKKLVRLRKYAIKRIKIDKYLEAYVIPREYLKDKLILVIAIRRGINDLRSNYFFDLYWFDSNFFITVASQIYNVIQRYYQHIHEECEFIEKTYSFSELLNYDVDSTDRIDINADLVDKILVSGRNAREFKIFIEKFFSITGLSERFMSKHEQVVKILENIARILGYIPHREYPINDSRLDIVWSSGSKLTHVFEVVVHGSIKEALYRLISVGGNVRRILVIDNDEYNVEKYVEKYRDKGVVVIGSDEVFKASRSLTFLEILLEKIK